MFLESCAIAICGILLGSLINMLAEALPARRALSLPRYADGSRRPWLAWLGIGAFLFNLRSLPESTTSGAAHSAVSSSVQSGGALLGWRYPLTEIASALLMLLVHAAIRADAALLAGAALFKYAYAALLLLMTIIDLEHRRIPFAVSFTLGTLAVIDALMFPASAPGLPASAIGGVVGFAVFYLVYLGGICFARIISGWRGLRGDAAVGSAFGFGDVLMTAAVGLMLGFPSIVLAMTFTVFMAAAGAVTVISVRYVKRGGYQAFDSIAFGPYIAGGALTMMLIGI